MELATRLELVTCCLQDSCATDCATPANAGTADECRAVAGHDSFLARTQQGGFAAYEIKFLGSRPDTDVSIRDQQYAPGRSRGNVYRLSPRLDAPKGELRRGRGIAPEPGRLFDGGDQASKAGCEVQDR